MNSKEAWIKWKFVYSKFMLDFWKNLIFLEKPIN